LDAGGYVAQRRHRVVIWAAVQGRRLPRWPEPDYQCEPGTSIVPDGLGVPVKVTFQKNKDTLKKLTVSDAIGDLNVPPTDHPRQVACQL
jgi:hypothetical protein